MCLVLFSCLFPRASLLINPCNGDRFVLFNIWSASLYTIHRNVIFQFWCTKWLQAGCLLSTLFACLLSVSFHQCSRLIFIYMLLLPEEQMGTSWEPSKHQCSFTHQGALDRKGLSLLFRVLAVSCRWPVPELGPVHVRPTAGELALRYFFFPMKYFGFPFHYHCTNVLHTFLPQELLWREGPCNTSDVYLQIRGTNVEQFCHCLFPSLLSATATVCCETAYTRCTLMCLTVGPFCIVHETHVAHFPLNLAFQAGWHQRSFPTNKHFFTTSSPLVDMKYIHFLQEFGGGERSNLTIGKQEFSATGIPAGSWTPYYSTALYYWNSKPNRTVWYTKSIYISYKDFLRHAVLILRRIGNLAKMMDFCEVLYYGVLLKYDEKTKVWLKLDKYTGHFPCFSLLAMTYIRSPALCLHGNTFNIPLVLL